jgi:hypothetical protein
VVDVDAAANDLVGRASCDLARGPCAVGAATVTVDDPAARLRQAEELQAAAIAQEEDAERQQARFESMTAAEHVEAARTALAAGFNADLGTGGDLEGAEQHLSRVPADDRGARDVRREIERRRRRQGEIARQLMEDQRQAIAARMDRAFIAEGVEVEAVEAVGSGHTTLRVRYALCGRVMADRLFGSAQTQADLRRAGFRKAECRGPFQTFSYDL